MSVITKQLQPPLTTYREKQVGKVTYRVTNEYIGKSSFTTVTEDLIIRKILRDENERKHE
ncbi:MAG: hypothetical protein FWC96_05935 [Oscillospiraceae bacterium]|nr:hypothetical protein [Oscillospiraceae bacterium]